MKPRERSWLDLRIGREVGRLRTDINHELGDLKTSDPFLPPDSDAARALEVVPVHEDVDHEIERDRDP